MNTSVDTQEQRIVSLEEELAHLRVQNEELSSETLDQWKRIEHLQKRLTLLEERFARLEDNPGTDSADNKPPHW